MTNPRPLLLTSDKTDFSENPRIREIVISGVLSLRPNMILNDDQRHSIQNPSKFRPSLNDAECTLRIRLDVDGFSEETDYRNALEHLKNYPDQYSIPLDPDLAYSTVFTPMGKE